MKFKKIFVALIVLSLLVGCVCATSITDFKTDGTFKELYRSDDMIVYADEHGDAGVAIFKLYDNVEDKDYNDDDTIEHLVHDDGDEYLTPDDDMKIEKNSDNTITFTDVDHGTSGVSEVVDHNGEKHVVIIWAKSTCDKDSNQLKADLDKFNKDNNVTPVAV